MHDFAKDNQDQQGAFLKAVPSLLDLIEKGKGGLVVSNVVSIKKIVIKPATKKENLKIILKPKHNPSS